MKKKVDSRIRTLIENGVQSHTRSFIVLVGDKGKDQVVNLHYMLSKAMVKARSVNCTGSRAATAAAAMRAPPRPP